MAEPCPGSKNGAHTWDIDSSRHGRCTNHGCSAEADFSSFIDMHRDHLRKEDLRVINAWRAEKKAEKEGKKVPDGAGDIPPGVKQGSAGDVPPGVVVVPPVTEPIIAAVVGSFEQAKRHYRSKKYYDDNRKEIEADIKKIGTMKALAKWNIASGTFTGIRRRWKKQDTLSAGKMADRAKVKPEETKPFKIRFCPNCGTELNIIKMQGITGEQRDFICAHCRHIFSIQLTGVVI